jgi:hypothetical protein
MHAEGDSDEEGDNQGTGRGEGAEARTLRACALAARLVDAFDLSNDELYRREQGKQQLHKLPHPKLPHLKFAKELGPRHMPLQPHELRLLRRPVLRDMPMLPRQADPKTGVVDPKLPRQGEPVQIVAGVMTAGNAAVTNQPQGRYGDHKDLRLRRGMGTDHILLTEYVEEHPLFLNRLGMASKAITYHVKSESSPAPPPPPVGDTKELEVEDELPFLLGPSIPNWEDGGSVSALQTNLFMAPAVAHAPLNTLNSAHAPPRMPPTPNTLNPAATATAGAERAGYTTFLLIRESAADERARSRGHARRGMRGVERVQRRVRDGGSHEEVRLQCAD